MQNAPTSPEVPAQIVGGVVLCPLMDEPELTFNAQGCAPLKKVGDYT